MKRYPISRMAWLAAAAFWLAPPAVAALPAEVRELGPFGRDAAAAMDHVGRFDARLPLSWSAPPPKQEGFIFPRETPGEVDRVVCEETQGFRVGAIENQSAFFGVGACVANAARLRDLAVAAEAFAARRLALIAKANPADLPDAERLIGHRRVALPGGLAGFHFVAVLISHGAIVLDTVVVHDPARRIAYVVQGYTTQLCGIDLEKPRQKPKPPAPTPFCPNTRKAMLDVAVELARIRSGRR